MTTSRLTSVGFWVGFFVGEGVMTEPVTPLEIPPLFDAGMIMSGGVGKASVTAIVGTPVVGSWVVGEIVGSFVVGETVLWSFKSRDDEKICKVSTWNEYDLIHFST